MKINLLKKAAALILSICMILSLTTPTFAAKTGEIRASNLGWTLEDGLLTIENDDGMNNWAANRTHEQIKEVTTVKIDDGVNDIVKRAFDSCINMTSIEIPSTVKSIGLGAFYNCNGLANITIPEGVETIGNYAFYSCTSLTNINIPDTVNAIGESAFYSCTNLKSINIPEGVKTIESGTFKSCIKLASVTIPEGVETIGDLAFYDCRSLTSVTIPSTVRSIGKEAFSHCTGLASITILAGVETIRESAFFNCSNLTSIIIPDTLKIIDRAAFQNCSGLTSVTMLATTPPTMGRDVFGNSGMQDESITVPKGYANDYKTAETWAAYADLVKPDHTHTFSDDWTFNDDYHWHAATCEHSDEVKGKAEHTWTVETVDPTETTEGKKTSTCSVCGKIVEETLPQLPHTHTFSDDWTSDDDYHWHAASCEHSDEVKGKAEHTWEVETVDPTETTEGKKTSTCSVCGKVVEETLPQLPHTHTFSDDWTFNDDYHWHAATCEHTDEVKGKAEHTWEVETVEPTETTEGKKTSTCSVCGKVVEETLPQLPHTHTFSDDWTSDVNYHWHAATCEHSDEVKGKAEHTWEVETVEPTETTEGKKTSTCPVCGKIVEETLPQLPHTHVPSSDWSEDESNHWHSCSGCDEKLDFAAHEWNEGEITTEPTEDKEGVKTFTCTVCQRTRTETVSRLEHTHVPGTDWTTDDSGHWHTCSGCDEKLDLANHEWDEGEITTEPTEDKEGVKTFTCDVCKRTRTEVVPALGHSHELKHVEYTKPTCAAKGTVEHYHCEKCGKNYSDSNGETELSEISIPIDSSNHAGGTEIRGAKKATCREKGYTGDTYCLGCDKLLSHGEVLPINLHSHNFLNGRCLDCGTLQQSYIYRPAITYLNDTYHFYNGMSRKHTPNRRGRYTDGVYEWYVCEECGREYGRKGLKIQTIDVSDPDSVELIVNDPVQCGDIELLFAAG